ncbi:MAG: ATP-binding cassette domain-containing protein [Streptosporangiales bacterium]|nr:ATP-binding cassette domain-containing protein [Streptosporangiales bacterium]
MNAPGTQLRGGDANLLTVRDLAVDFTTGRGPLRAVDGVSFDVSRGQTVALVGESGSGKSTTGLAVMGLLPRTKSTVADGTVSFLGNDITAAHDKVMRDLRGAHVSMVFQDPLSALNPVLTIGKQLREMFTRHRGMSSRQAREAAIELLHRVRMPDPERRYRQYPQQFSGGMRQRVVIAMALALEPELIIADEPTTALDVTVQARIMALLRHLTAEQGSGLLLVTHDLAVVAESADQIYVMYAGRVMESGPIRPVYTRPANPYTVGLLASAPTLSAVDRPLHPIPGKPPDPTERPVGCAFHPRCPLATARCREEQPPLREIAPGRLSACHFAEEVHAGGHDQSLATRAAASQ